VLAERSFLLAPVETAEPAGVDDLEDDRVLAGGEVELERVLIRRRAAIDAVRED
jgi:hypothetical protein